MTEIVSDVCAGAIAPTRVKLPTWAACLPAVGGGRMTRAGSLATGPVKAKGTGVPGVGARTHVQPSFFGPKPIRDNYTKTRANALGGGAVGPHPAREPEPV